MPEHGNDTRLVTWPQFAVLGGVFSVVLGLAIGGLTGWVNQLDEAKRRDIDTIIEDLDRNREQLTNYLQRILNLDGRVDRLEAEQTVDPRDLSDLTELVTNLEERLDGLDKKTDRILERLSERFRGPS